MSEMNRKICCYVKSKKGTEHNNASIVLRVRNAIGSLLTVEKILGPKSPVRFTRYSSQITMPFLEL